MARLTAKQRKRMSKSEFAEPGDKGFPDEDAKHQRLAISGATRSYNAGNISKSEEERIKSRERKKLGITKRADGGRISAVDQASAWDRNREC